MKSNYRNISNIQGGEKLTAWQEKSRQKKAEAEEKSKAKLDARPGWNDTVVENPHKISHAEVL